MTAVETLMQAEIDRLRAELAKHQESEFHPDWSMLAATRNSLAEHQDMIRRLSEQVRVLRDALDVAWARMDTAREILTEGNPRQNCNWGLLDTSIARAALEAK